LEESIADRTQQMEQANLTKVEEGVFMQERRISSGRRRNGRGEFRLEEENFG